MTFHHSQSAPGASFSFEVPIQTPQERSLKRHRDEDEDDEDDIHPSSSFPSHLDSNYSSGMAPGADEEEVGDDPDSPAEETPLGECTFNPALVDLPPVLATLHASVPDVIDSSVASSTKALSRCTQPMSSPLHFL